MDRTRTLEWTIHDVRNVRPELNYNECVMVLQQLEVIFKADDVVTPDQVSDVAEALWIL